MTSEIEDDISALASLDLEGLRDAWRARYGAPPKLRSPEMLGLMLAWRIQAEAGGGLSVECRRALRRPIAERTQPKAAGGVRLAREWKGVKHDVVALGDEGFLYDGQRYESLSQIARLITGVRWNGPRFFGLRDPS